MALNKRCTHCCLPLSYGVLLKQTVVMVCPHCKKILHATFLSRFIFSIIFIVPFAFILMGMEGNSSKLFVIAIWIMISFLVIQPLVLRYK